MTDDERSWLAALSQKVTFKATATRVETYLDGVLDNVWTPINPDRPDDGWEVEPAP